MGILNQIESIQDEERMKEVLDVKLICMYMYTCMYIGGNTESNREHTR